MNYFWVLVLVLTFSSGTAAVSLPYFDSQSSCEAAAVKAAKAAAHDTVVDTFCVQADHR